MNVIRGATTPTRRFKVLRRETRRRRPQEKGKQVNDVIRLATLACLLCVVVVVAYSLRAEL